MTVWVQLAEMFGKAFYREHGGQPTRLWQQAINRLTDKQIATGLAELGNSGLAFPPNLSQFITACKTVRRTPYWSTPRLEDQREPGTMSYAEWKQVEHAKDTNKRK